MKIRDRSPNQESFFTTNRKEFVRNHGFPYSRKLKIRAVYAHI